MKYKLNKVFLLASTFFITQSYGQQQQVSSLLSNYGLGTVFSEATMAERAQGGLSVVNNNTEEVTSISNPALLGNLKLTSFSLGFQSQGANIKSQDGEITNSALSLSNLSLGIPLGKGGVYIGLRAKSAVGFEVSSLDFYNEGNGGVNQFYVGFGYQVAKGLSLGGQYSQYFGKTDKKQAFKGVQEATVFDQSYNVKGNSFKLGAQYKYAFSKKVEVNAGAYAEFNYDITATGTSRFFKAIETSPDEFRETNQSILNGEAITNTIRGVEENPLKLVYGVGAGRHNSWFAGLSYETKGAVSYTGNAFEQTIQTDFDDNGSALRVGYEASSKLSLGGYIIPKKYALKNYLKRVIYRAGIQHQKTGLVLNNNSVNDLGMSFGLGLPVGRRISYLNLSVELGRRGEFSKNKYEEEYINVGVNFSLSDKWFKKRVID